MRFRGRPDGLGNRIGEIILCGIYCMKKNIIGEYFWNNRNGRTDRRYPILFKTKHLLIQNTEYISERDDISLIPKPTLNEKIEAAATIKPLFNIKFENKIKPVGIHIRACDKINATLLEGGISPNHLLRNIHETINILNNLEIKYVFICSDDENLKKYFKSKLNKNIIICNPICDDGVPDEYRDFFALSLCKELYLCSKFSSFSVTASLIGNININVFLPRTEMVPDAQEGGWMDAKYKHLMVHKTIIIIPYRDRASHLKYWLKNTYPLIKKVIPDVEVIVVEQTEGKKFNRGATINIGYLYYNNEEYSYITQDVDVNPIDDKIINLYGKNVEQDTFLGIYSDGQTLGGIVKCTGTTFKKVNGFPNDYWGWGHEDKDLSNRAEFYNCLIERKIKFNDLDKSKYLKIFQDNHIREDSGKWGLAYGRWNSIPNDKKRRYIESNGLSSLKYKIIKDEILMDGVRKITVDF